VPGFPGLDGEMGPPGRPGLDGVKGDRGLSGNHNVKFCKIDHDYDTKYNTKYKLHKYKNIVREK